MNIMQKALARLETVASTSEIWGGITILKPTKVDVDWGGESIEVGLKKIASLKGTEYKKDWIWSGDLDPSECDILVVHQGKRYGFRGKNAITDLVKKFK